MASEIIGIIAATVCLSLSAYMVVYYPTKIASVWVKVAIVTYGGLFWTLGWYFLWLGIAALRFRFKTDQVGGLPPLWVNDILSELRWLAITFTAIWACGVSAYVFHIIRTRHIANRKIKWVGAGLCGECGYDLRGSPSGVCPECGASAPASTHDQDDSK